MKGTRMSFKPLKAIAFAPALLLIGAAADAPLSAGLWEVRNTPGVATLDDRPLEDLPLSPIKTQTICVSAAQAADPVRFFAQDTQAACTITSGTAAGGQVKIAATCPGAADGEPGRLEMSGRYAGASYAIDFATTAYGDNGKMTFSGKLTGRRVGNCPA